VDEPKNRKVKEHTLFCRRYFFTIFAEAELFLKISGTGRNGCVRPLVKSLL
jgi:hypothetical protein